MNDSKQKIKELMVILRYLFLETDKTNTLKYLDYVRKIKEEYGLEVDRRKVMRVLDDLKQISDEDKNKKILPFKVSISKKGKWKFCRDEFELDDMDIENIVASIDAYQMLSSNETKELKNKVINLLSTKSQRKKLSQTNGKFRITKTLKSFNYKDYLSCPNYRQLFVLTKDVSFGNIEFYPKDNAESYLGTKLTGYIYKYVCYKNKPYIILMLHPERVAVAAPVQNVEFFKEDGDFENDPNSPFVFNFNFHKGLHYSNIEQWVSKLLSNELGNQEVVTLKINCSRYSKTIMESLKTYYPNQNIRARKLPNSMHDLVLLGEGLKHQEALYIESFLSDWDSFLSWYMSDINIIKQVDIITPAKFVYRIADFGKMLFEKGYKTSDSLINYILQTKTTN